MAGDGVWDVYVYTFVERTEMAEIGIEIENPSLLEL